MISVRLIGRTSASLSFNRGVASLAAAFLPSGGLLRRSQTSKLRLDSKIGLSSYTSRAFSSTKLALEVKSDDGRDEENRGTCISRRFGAVPLMPSREQIELWSSIRYPGLPAKPPSVSKILSDTCLPEKRQALLRWREEQTKLLGVEGFKKLETGFKTTGTRFHKGMQIYTKFGEEKVPQEYKEDNCWKSFCLNPDYRNITPLEKSSPIAEAWVQHSKLDYLGKLDAVCNYNGEIHLIDWKSSKPRDDKYFKKWVRDYMLQIAAYLGALNCETDKYDIPQIARVLVAICYTDGATPAKLLPIEGDQLLQYWADWLKRVDEYWDQFPSYPPSAFEPQTAGIALPLLKPYVGGIVGSASVDTRKLQSDLNLDLASLSKNIPRVAPVLDALKRQGTADVSSPEYEELLQLIRALKLDAKSLNENIAKLERFSDALPMQEGGA